LVNGKLISRDADHPVDGLPTITTYMMDNWHRGPILILQLTGRATQVEYVSLKFNRFIPVKSFYVDETGLPDVGFRRGMYLRLDRRALDVVFDDLLSGKFAGLLDS
jgi:hypothetical protein